MCIYELPITHMDDPTMLSTLNIEGHLSNINMHLSENDSHVYHNFSRVIPYSERVLLYDLFNSELKDKCKINNFTFVEINKYFRNAYGNFEIPMKYINTYDITDHHLLENVVELFLESLQINKIYK